MTRFSKPGNSNPNIGGSRTDTGSGSGRTRSSASPSTLAFRQRGGATANRPSRRGAKSATSFSGQVNVLEYTNYDDAMEEGVEYEEKGERFQFGDKAQRFFQQSYNLYIRATTLKPNSADGYYNAARVQYLLGTQFYLLPKAVFSLVDSIVLFKRAASLAPALPSSSFPLTNELPSPFTLDVLSNLATALQTLGEMMDEIEWSSLPSALDAARQLATQSDYSRFSDTSDPEPASPTPAKILQEAIEIFRFTCQGQLMVLKDQAAESESQDEQQEQYGEDEFQGKKESNSTVPVDNNSGSLDDNDNEEMSLEQQESDPSSATAEYAFTSSLVTTSSYIETLFSLSTCLVSLLTTCDTVEKIAICYVNAEQALNQAQQAIEQSTTATTAVTPSGLPSLDEQEKNSLQTEWKRVHLSLQVSRLTKLAELSVFPSDQQEFLAIEEQIIPWANSELESSCQQQKVDIATLCELGDAGLSLARLRLRQVAITSCSFTSLSFSCATSASSIAIIQAWKLGTLSFKCFNTALTTLDTSSTGSGGPRQIVLGATHTSTVTSRTRSSILTSLSSLSLFRCHPVFQLFSTCSSGLLPGAANTRSKLIESARIYSRKSLVEIGLGWILQPPSSNLSFLVENHAISHGGYDTLRSEADAIFTLLRALFIREIYNSSSTTATTTTTTTTTNIDETKMLKTYIDALSKKKINGNDDTCFSFMYSRKGDSSSGGKRYLDGVVVEEAEILDSAELQAWRAYVYDE